jgi:hypothetical protein
VSVLADGDAWSDVVLDVGYSAGVSVAAPDGVEAVVSMDLRDVPAEVAFRELAARAGMVALYADGVVTFVPSDGQYESFAVFGVGGVDPSVLYEALQLALGREGQARPVGDRVAVAASTEGMERAQDAIRRMTEGPDGWIVQVVVTRVNRAFAREYGIDWTVGGRVRVGGGLAVGDAFERFGDLGASVSGLVEAAMKASEDGRDAVVVSRASLYLLEGTPVSLQQGDAIPVPQRTISPEGVVTVTGYTTVRTGFELQCVGRRVADGLLLELRPKISSVTGTIEGAPITSERTVEAVAVVQSGQWIVLSGLDEWSASRDDRGLPVGWLGGATSERADQGTTLIFCRATRVYAGGGVVDPGLVITGDPALKAGS